MQLHQLAAVLLMAAATACASSPPGTIDLPPAQAALCAPRVSLGKVDVAPVTRWRADQKEPQVREAIVMKAVEAVAPAISCASSVKILSITTDANAADRLAEAKAGGATTAIFIRVDELGPIATLSFPALWSTWSDVKFTLDAVDVQSGANLRSIPHRRQKGGAFEVRGLDPLQHEMELALKDVILGAR